jgi:hypothetical protein
MRKALRRFFATAALTSALLALSASPAIGGLGDGFGFEELDVTFTNEDGSPATQAGSHPYAMTTTLNLNRIPDPKFEEIVDGYVRDLIGFQIPGQVGEPTATPRCSTVDFLKANPASSGPIAPLPNCANATALGQTTVSFLNEGTIGDLGPSPVFNLEPPPGAVAKLGFWVAQVPVTVELGVNSDPPYNVVGSLRNISQVLMFASSDFILWGDPADPVHDTERGICLFTDDSCPANIPRKPFLTLPRACEGPLTTAWEADSWQNPGVWAKASSETHDSSGNPLGFTGCGKLAFSPSILAQPTTKASQSPSGLDFSLDVTDEGLTNPTGIAASDIKKTVVTLPEGFSTNPSLAEGLEVCSEADLDRETVKSPPGAGCPNASKVGTVEVETPLLEESVNGALYVAEPFNNPFDSLIALYIVIKNPTLGIVVKQPLQVIPNPKTGQLTTVAEDLPQLPFSHFRLHFREGTRSPLASPPACGDYAVKAELHPWSGAEPVTTASAFSIISGPGGGPCPTGGLPPFRPGLIAGTLNNAAGRFSPFNVRLFRTDSEQEFTRFSIKLPPGIVGILAGIPYCPDAAIEAAKTRSGTAELTSPSCPAASEIGHTLAGGGVGPSLAYAPGKVYLAGPYKGTAFSLAAITAVKVGPFDLGTVVVRQGFKVDRETAEVFIDATESDPIPHIIDGIPVHARDIRAYVDRSKFVFNPTNCKRTSTASTLLGSGLDFASAADDRPVTVSTPFQAADCAALKFDPKLKLQLKGGTKRGQHPAFRAVLNMKGGPETGEANIARARVTLPRSAFLEQGHIKTICTRVQFRADQCPAGSVYGYARAFTPVLAEPLEGPVYLRSSEHQLPDLVASLHHEKITVDVVGRIDSLKGRIRNTFEAVPDAPVSKFILTMQGGKKGLIVNSTNLCKGKHRAIAEFSAQNGRTKNFRPALEAKCGKSGKAKKRRAG